MNLEEIINNIKPLDRQRLQEAVEHTQNLAIPPRALGRLHDISEKLCAIQGRLEPRVDQKAFIVMAGDHGVAAEGVSAFPQEVTGEMVKNFLAGGASINALAHEVGAEVWVVDMGIIPEIDTSVQPRGGRWESRKIAPGTANMVLGPAMTKEQAEQALKHGFEMARQAFDSGVELLGTGDMGIANTTSSTAIVAAVCGGDLNDLVGRGTGVDDAGLARKREVVACSLKVNQVDPKNGLDILSKIGGFEIGGIAGCILAGAYFKKPVVIDGLISTAGALIAHTLCPSVSDYLFAGHCSHEPAHKIMLRHLGLEPIIDLGLRLGEGTGAALAMGVISGAARMFREVLTFEQAGVTPGE